MSKVLAHDDLDQPLAIEAATRPVSFRLAIRASRVCSHWLRRSSSGLCRSRARQATASESGPTAAIAPHFQFGSAGGHTRPRFPCTHRSHKRFPKVAGSASANDPSDDGTSKDPDDDDDASDDLNGDDETNGSVAAGSAEVALYSIVAKTASFPLRRACRSHIFPTLERLRC